MEVAMTHDPHITRIALTDEQKRRRRGRNIAIALSLAALVVLFYLVTIVKLGPSVLNRPL
ncbi:MAG: hypothetical protein JO245_12600 [Pseudolabrys sp.]|nr:hypothetical protein [Pseudolabrys sp.]